MPGGLIGALRVTLGLDTAAFEAGSARARKTAAADATAITRAYSGMSSAISGLLAGISVGALVAAGKRALEYASSLGEVAQQLGVTTKDLQEYRYAASQVGVSQEEMDKGLSKLTVTMGKARAGMKAATAPFAELSTLLGKDILKSASTAGDAIPLIAEALAKVRDPAARAAYEVALFGKTGQKLDTLLSGGASGVDTLRDAAERLGLVLSEEQIAKADETADKLAELNQQLEAKLAGTVSDNADSILTLANALASLVDWLGRAITNYKAFSKWAGHKVDGGIGWTMTGGEAAGPQAAAARARWKSDETDLNAPFADWAAKTKAGNMRKLRGAAGSTGAGAGSGGGSKKKGKSAEQIAKEQERAAEQQARETAAYENDLGQARRAELDARADLTGGIDARYESEMARIAEDRAENARQAALMKGITEKQRQSLLAEQDKALVLREQIAEQDRARSLAERDYEIARNTSDATQEELQGRLSLAETIGERRNLELALLAERKRIEQQYLDMVMKTAKTNSPEYQDALSRSASIDQRYGLQAEQIDRANLGPWAQFLKTLPDTAAKANEAIEHIAADGMESLNDGLADAIMNSKSLGDVFSNVADQMIRDFIKLGLQEAQSSIFGGGGGGGFMSMFRTLTSSHSVGGSQVSNSLFEGLSQGNGVTGLPGMANGGMIKIGGNRGVDTNLLSINGMPVARVNYGETLRVDPAGTPRGSKVSMTLHNDFRGADASAVAGINARLDRMQRELPGQIVSVSSDAKQRGYL